MNDDLFAPTGPERILAEGVTVHPVRVHGKDGHVVRIDGNVIRLKWTELEAVTSAEPRIRRHLGRLAFERAQAAKQREIWAAQAACARHEFVEATIGRCLTRYTCTLCGFTKVIDSGD